MTNALPQAIGARPARPGRQVIVLSGAGRLPILLGELMTLRQQQLVVKIIMFNAAALSFVELEVKAAAIVTYGTDLDNPDFAPIARATGPSAMRAEKAGEIDKAAAVVRHHGPGHGPHRPAGIGVGTAWLVLRIFTFRNCRACPAWGARRYPEELSPSRTSGPGSRPAPVSVTAPRGS
jgi:hypothetical protein